MEKVSCKQIQSTPVRSIFRRIWTLRSTTESKDIAKEFIPTKQTFQIKPEEASSSRVGNVISSAGQSLIRTDQTSPTGGRHGGSEKDENKKTVKEILYDRAPHLKSLIESIEPAIIRNFRTIRFHLRRADPKVTGMVDFSVLKNILSKSDISFTKEEEFHLLEYFDSHLSGRINYREFLRIFVWAMFKMMVLCHPIANVNVVIWSLYTHGSIPSSTDQEDRPTHTFPNDLKNNSFSEEDQKGENQDDDSGTRIEDLSKSYENLDVINSTKSDSLDFGLENKSTDTIPLDPNTIISEQKGMNVDSREISTEADYVLEDFQSSSETNSKIEQPKVLRNLDSDNTEKE
ncbi:EF-hand calcium-binding domain-containing protein 6 [Trichonephila inaurata madagascariensis]|uniref:EF-hand calcium-binding domain-containing protein 6 n=1 Tax=Trichonephila inaurata madagascariensis TaxID=2747483 RepID=A0A8X7CEA3_9ARAC|nr:EF-hand calcium-binding domain-containing protein 6 [Trichonephila inaurata madagascariensis]